MREWARTGIAEVARVVLLAQIVGSACTIPPVEVDPGQEGDMGERVTSSAGLSDAPPITFQASINGFAWGRPGDRVWRTWGLADTAQEGDLHKFTFTWTPPPGVTRITFVTPPEPGGPPFVFRNVQGGNRRNRRIEFELPPLPPGEARWKLVDSLAASYEGAVSVASLTTRMPNAESFEEEPAGTVSPLAAAAAPTPGAPQLWSTSHYFRTTEALDTSACQSIANLLQGGRSFVAVRVVGGGAAPAAEAEGDVLPVAMRGSLGPTLALSRRPPTTTYFSLPLEYAPGRQTFLENALPAAPGERWLALAAVPSPKAVCPTIAPPAAAGEWQLFGTLNLDLPAKTGTLTSYVCYEGERWPLPAPAAVARLVASSAGLDAVQAEGISCLGPMPLALGGGLTVEGGASPLLVGSAVAAARTIRLPHRLRWLGSGTVVTRVSVDSALPVTWSLYRSAQSGSACLPPDTSAPITPGVTNVNVQPGSFAGPCVWLVGTIPAGSDLVPGPYAVKLTATMVPAMLGSSWASDQIWYGGWQPPPAPAAPRRYDYYVPAAANTDGANGTRWLSDLDILNAGDEEASVEVACLVKNRANTDPATARVAVPAGTAVRLVNVLGSTFRAANAALGIKVRSGRAIATSRFYNTASKCGGTFGMALRGEGPEDAVVHGRPAHFNLLAYSRDAARGFRVNLGFVNDSESDTEVEIRLFGDAGELLKTVSWTLLPFEHRQFTRIHADPAPVTAAVAHGWATVTVRTPGGRVHAYAMLIDNVSGDPVYIRQGRAAIAPMSGHYDLCVAAAANTGGANGTRWQTDLDLLNPGAEDAEVGVACLLKNQANPAPEVERVQIPAGRTVRLANVLGTTFDAANAAIGIEVGSGSVIAGSRFYNTASACGGSYGMFVPGGGVGRLAAAGTAAYFGLLSYSPDGTQGFRVNIGFVNDSASATRVELDLHGDSGELLKTVALELQPYEHRQLTRVHRDPPPATPAVSHGFARVRVTTPGGAVHAYAMLIDNVSGDPVYIDPVLQHM